MFGFNRTTSCLIVCLAWCLRFYTFGNTTLWFVYAVPLFVSIVYALGTYDHGYWASKGVFSPPAFPFVGHIVSVITFKEQGGLCFKRIYDTYKDVKFLGTHQFYQRTLVVRDPELIKRMCVNDFQHFVDRGFWFREDVDPLAGSVLYLRGAKWKRLRAKISPIFSPNKLRGMFPLIDDTCNEFLARVKTRCISNSNKIIKQETNNNRCIVDSHTKTILEKSEETNNNYCIADKCGEKSPDKKEKTNDNQCEANSYTKSQDRLENITEGPDNVYHFVANSEKLAGGFTADAIVPCAFGLKSHVMDNENDPFAVALHAFYEMTPFNIFEKTMRQFWPAFVLFFRMKIIPKKTHDFFYNIVTSVLRAREKGDQERRGDFIDMMMALRNDSINQNSKPVEEGEDVEITDMVIAANAFIIFLGGFETTSSTLAFMFLELAHHPEVQEKMRKEIQQVQQKYHGQINYEALQEFTYMEMVIQESLRLYPPFPMIQRLCTKDYVIPGTRTVVEQGTIVLFPTLAVHRDPQYFERADQFDPSRWADDHPPPPPGVYMPFGDGPRYCIGKRFAIIQMKCCLIKLLQHVRFSPAPGSEPRTGPFTPDPRSPLTLHPLDSKVTISLL